MDDGLLDIFVFKGLGFSYALRHLMSLFSGRALQNPKLLHALARTIYIETSPPVAVQLDGEPLGNSPTVITIAPRTLRMVIPPQAPESLFSQAPELVL
jgi:diacylglycerol kinase family enzyme